MTPKDPAITDDALKAAQERVERATEYFNAAMADHAALSKTPEWKIKVMNFKKRRALNAKQVKKVLTNKRKRI